MYESELNIGLLGFDKKRAAYFQKRSDEKKQGVKYNMLPDMMAVDRSHYDGVIQRSNDIVEIATVQQYLPDSVKYGLLTTTAENLPEELMESCDFIYPLPDWDAVSHLADFYLDRFIENIKVSHDAWMNNNCLDTIIDMLPDLIWFKDLKGAHLKVNDAFCKIVRKEKEDIEGRGHYYIWGLTEEEYANGEFVCLETEEEVLRRREVCLFDEQVMGPRGMRELKTYKAPIWDRFGNIIGTCGVARDVTRMNKYRDNILTMVRHDYLTGLSNRRHLYSFVRKNWRSGQLAILYCDLDNFKQVNDKYGHAAGDKALVIASKALLLNLDETMVARVGGDEFLAAFIGEYKVSDIVSKCVGISRYLKKVFSEHEEYRGLSISIGIATAQHGVMSVDEVITKADEAMYVAKKSKDDPMRKPYHIYGA